MSTLLDGQESVELNGVVVSFDEVRSTLSSDLAGLNGHNSQRVSAEIVNQVYRECCRFSVPGSEQTEKNRIRRYLEVGLPLILGGAGVNGRF